MSSDALGFEWVDYCPHCGDVEVSGKDEPCADCADSFCRACKEPLDDDNRCPRCEAEEAADRAMDLEAEERI